MDRRTTRVHNDDDPSIGPVASLAIVLRMPIDRMPEVFALISEVHGVRVVYQRTSAGRLTIIEER